MTAQSGGPPSLSAVGRPGELYRALTDTRPNMNMTFTTIRASLALVAATALSGCVLEHGDAHVQESEARAPISLVEAMAEAAPRADADAYRGDPAALEGAALETRSVLYALHLASYRSAASAEAGWRILAAEAPSALGDLHPRVERVDLGADQGEFLRLKAGPVDSQAEAMARCAALTQSGHYCRTTDFAGSELAGG